MSPIRTKRILVLVPLLSISTILVAAGLLFAFAQGANADTYSPQAPMAVDAYLELRPTGGAPASGGTVSVGQRFTLELFVNSGSNQDVSAQQSFLSFNSAVLQVVSASGSGCSPASTVSADTAKFEAVLQNQVCNGPTLCTGQISPEPGSFAFASGALTNPSTGGQFRVASIAFCAINGGRADISWEFSPPEPANRNTKLVSQASGDITDQSRFRTYTINASGATATPNPAATATARAMGTATAPPVVPTATIGGGGGGATPPPNCTMNFSDVAQDNPFYENIRRMFCNGVVSGYNDGTFKPWDYTLRSQIAKIVVLGFDLPLNEEGPARFSDVPQGTDMYKYIQTAANLGLVDGFNDGTFRPWENVKRGQLTKIAVLAAAQKDPSGWDLENPSQPSFTDVPRDNNYYRHVETARAHNMITGFNDRTYRLYDLARRGQVAKIVDGALSSR